MEDDPNSTANAPDDIGYARPPRRTRFKPGSSGNPWGRPKRKHREAPYEHLLGRLVTITEAGAERKVTAAEAFLLQLTKRGLEGDNVAARATMRAIEEMRAHGTTKPDDILSICRQIVSPGSVKGALEVLRMAELVEGYSSDNASDAARSSQRPCVSLMISRISMRSSWMLVIFPKFLPR